MADAVAGIARALLYEGFALYPYRASALKNRSRWFFGGVYPPAWAALNPGDRDHVGAQMLLQGFDFTLIGATVRFLHFDGSGGATERCVEISPCALAEIANRARVVSFDLGSVSLSATPIGDAYRIEVAVRNASVSQPATRDEAVPHTMASLHAVLRAADGDWISLLDPPPAHADAARACRQLGLYPVLVGPDGSHDTMLAS
ncbi:MAG TPA: hypothetical protein VFB36_11835, partial [Nevskiaceae bacterium]|nr:hypothetical protein [Nevskiaceae bacterium]